MIYMITFIHLKYQKVEKLILPVVMQDYTLLSNRKKKKLLMLCWLMLVIIPWEAYFKQLIQRSEEHTSELQSRFDLVCRLLLEKKNSTRDRSYIYSVPRTYLLL